MSSRRFYFWCAVAFVSGFSITAFLIFVLYP